MPRVSPARALIIEVNPEYRAVIGCCAGLADLTAESVATVSAGVHRLSDAEFDLVIWGVPPGDPRRAPVIAQIHEESTAPLLLLDEAGEEARASYLAWRSTRYSAEQLRSYVMRVRRKMAPLELPFAVTSQQGRGYRFDLDGSDR